MSQFNTLSQPNTLPQPLQDLIQELTELPANDRLELLVELGEELPALPEHYSQNPELLEAVPECQSPIFLAVEVQENPEQSVQLFFSAPPEAVTTRGLAALLYEGLNGQPTAAILALPADLALQLPLDGIVSPLRLNGFTGMLTRLQRQIKEKI